MQLLTNICPELALDERGTYSTVEPQLLRWENTRLHFFSRAQYTVSLTSPFVGVRYHCISRGSVRWDGRPW